MDDDALEAKVIELVEKERTHLRELLVHLGEFDSRKIAEKKAFGSSFMYCTQRLGYSEGAAYRRIHAARAARDYPALLDLIETGRLSMMSIAMIRPFMTDANQQELMLEAQGKSRRELEFFLASLSPRNIERACIRVVSKPASPAGEDRPDSGGGFAFAKPDRLEPLVQDRIRIAFTSTRQSYDKLERARQLLRHKYPFGQVEDIFDQALEDLLDKRDPDRRIKRQKAERRARAGRLEAGRRIPQWVKDEVWQRDGGRCAYAGRDGRRCSERAFLEYDHIVPYALGGPSDTPKNIRLLCRAHNQDAGRAVFGARALGASGGQRLTREASG